MTIKKSIPIIIGASQYTQSKNSENPIDPIGMMAKACRDALEDTGLEVEKKFIDTLYVSNVYCLAYENAPEDLAERLQINPDKKYYAPIGGNTPQMLVNRAARAIELKKSQIVLITGGESCYSLSRGKKKEIVLNWEKGSSTSRNKALIEYASKMSISEKKYKIIQPSAAYALFETALRANSGRTIKNHLEHMGDLFERFSKVAAHHPNAWSRKIFTKEEIITPSLNNRIINHPYMKHMVANPYVDQSAAILMTREDIAEKQGIDIEKWVYLMGGIDLSNIKEIARRPKLYNSPAIKEASKLALKQAGLSLKDITGFDLYSCFPCMVDIARNEIGLSEDDPRNLTLTGGLPFFGAPFNNYSMHAIVTAIELIRKKSSSIFMITANGGYNDKQSIGIYGKRPPHLSWDDLNVDSIQESIKDEALREPITKANGFLMIEAYTIYYNREGEPTGGLAIGNLEGKGRALAFFNAKTQVLKKIARKELVGMQIPVKFDNKKQINELIFSD